MKPAPPVTNTRISTVPQDENYHLWLFLSKAWKKSYYFPEPAKTSCAVFSKIHKSNFKVQREMYSRSSFTHSSKSFTSFLPLTCHRQVIPGFTASFCF